VSYLADTNVVSRRDGFATPSRMFRGSQKTRRLWSSTEGKRFGRGECPGRPEFGGLAVPMRRFSVVLLYSAGRPTYIAQPPAFRIILSSAA